MAVRIALAKYRIDRGSENFGIASLDLRLVFIGRVVWIKGNVIALDAKFFDAIVQLWN